MIPLLCPSRFAVTMLRRRRSALGVLLPLLCPKLFMVVMPRSCPSLPVTPR
ncbi:hypothetical protein [Amycolatopsis panacis]|uniref:hypothetical protein n=1 Tax=Amycolatopsis panacis TaxID=2340917 RepID=UPI001314BF0A|nr:hypothetical protein [Amycolatopsis panacis]